MKIYKIFTLLIVSLLIQHNAFCIIINGTTPININTNVTITSAESPILTQNGTNILNEINTRHNPVPSLFSAPQALNIATIDSGLKQFLGSAIDGSYLYLSHYGGAKAVRMSLNDFTTNGVTIINLASVNANLTQFGGAATDGKYLYLAPNKTGTVARIDLNDFTTNGVTALNLIPYNSKCKQYAGCCVDQNYLYLINNQTYMFTRISLTNFNTNGISIIDTSSISSNLSGFVGGTIYGKYFYTVSAISATIGTTNVVIARFDLNDFTTNGISFVNLNSIDSLTNLGTCQNIVTDGRYLYSNAYSDKSYNKTGLVIRISINDFTTNSVKFLDLTTIDSSYKGYLGSLIYNGYLYLSPYNNGSAFGKAIRIDLNNFNTNGVSMMDLSTFNANYVAYHQGMVHDKYYIYFNPFNNGYVTRILVTYGGNF